MNNINLSHKAICIEPFSLIEALGKRTVVYRECCLTTSKKKQSNKKIFVFVRSLVFVGVGLS